MNRDQWWIDFVEGELDPTTEFEMRRILRTSYKDLELISSIKAIKKLIRHHEDVPEPGPIEMKRLHNNIMEHIMNKDLHPSFVRRRTKPKSEQSIHLHLIR